MCRGGSAARLIIGGRLRQGTTGWRVSSRTSRCARTVRSAAAVSAAASAVRRRATALLAAIEHLHGEHLDLDDLIALAASGDAGVRRVLEDGGREIGTVLASICTVLDPDAVIVGGELGYAGSPLLDGVRAAVERGALPGTTAAKVIPRSSGRWPVRWAPPASWSAPAASRRPRRHSSHIRGDSF